MSMRVYVQRPNPPEKFGSAGRAVFGILLTLLILIVAVQIGIHHGREMERAESAAEGCAR